MIYGNSRDINMSRLINLWIGKFFQFLEMGKLYATYLY